MLDINILLTLILTLLFSCQNVKKNSEKSDTLIDGKYPVDSILFEGFEPFIREDCAMEISEMVKDELYKLIQDDDLQIIIRQKKVVWFSIIFRANGSIIDFQLNSKVLPHQKEKKLKKVIMKKKLKITCNAINDLDEIQKNKIIAWVIPIKYENK